MLQRKDKGFTLLEIVMAMGLSVFVLAIAYTTYFSINSAVEAASEGREAAETGPVLIDLIRKDLRGAASPASHDFIGNTTEGSEGEHSSSIEFVTTTSMDRNSLGLNKVGYLLVALPGSEKAFVRRQSNDLKADLGKNGRAFELSRIITAFELSFYDGNSWADKWDSKVQNRLPLQVRIKITVDEGKRNSREFIGVETIPGAM